MNRREISHQDWVPFLDQFSQAHLGERVEVRVIGIDGITRLEARRIPLLGITDERAGKPSEEIEVIAGDSRRGNMVHVVSHPVHVRVAEAADGSPLVMRIDSADGTSTRVRFIGTRGDA